MALASAMRGNTGVRTGPVRGGRVGAENNEKKLSFYKVAAGAPLKNAKNVRFCQVGGGFTPDWPGAGGAANFLKNVVICDGGRVLTTVVAAPAHGPDQPAWVSTHLA